MFLEPDTATLSQFIFDSQSALLVEMLRSSTQLVKSHGDDLGLEYLWNGDEYGSLENRWKAMEKNAEYGGQPEILALVHVIERPITVHYEDSDKGTVFG